ncbi:G2 and S phase-expressed protein 1 [Protopterus annectens]|uniref:G2 and S phase-expressed protein 1 n=1 Tax=Protopterus annectens TaxID=7888 RepID=UPI001CFB097E|nr:G2 and S phase-expressed protein 1 [Protopterus annectens]
MVSTKRMHHLGTSSYNSCVSGKDDEDEVFVGPVGHKEKCVAVNIEISNPQESKESSPSPELLNWSPLAGEKFVEIFKEAHMLALQLENSSKHCAEKSKPPEKNENLFVEKFVAESKSKLKIFQLGCESYRSPAAAKRETFIIRQTPTHQLPPSLQQCVEIKVPAVNPNDSNKTLTPDASPVNQTVEKALEIVPTHKQNTNTDISISQKRISSAGVKKLPVKSQTGKTTLPGKIMEKPKPGFKGSPRRRHPSSAGSLEDLHSDNNTSITSDISDSSFNSSSLGLGKRTLPLPSKTGFGKPSGLRHPGTVNSAGRPVRKNTSSSSSSSINSSFNSSLSISPTATAGKVTAYLSTSLNSSSSSKMYASCSSNNRLNSSKTLANPASSLQSGNSSNGSHRFYKSASTGKLPQSGNVGGSTVGPISHHQTPAKKDVPRISSATRTQKVPQMNKAGGAAKVNSCPKPKTSTGPTPTAQLKANRLSGVPSAEASSAQKIMPPKRILPGATVGSGVAASTPVKTANKAPPTPSFSGKSICATFSGKRTSTLPASLNRLSGIGTAASKTMLRSSSSPHLTSNLSGIRMSSKKSSASSKQIPPKAQVELSPHKTSEEELSPPLVPCSLDFSFDDRSQASQNEISKKPEGVPPLPLVPELETDVVKPHISKEDMTQGTAEQFLQSKPCSVDSSVEKITGQVLQDKVNLQTMEMDKTEVLLIDLDLGSQNIRDKPLIDLYKTPEKKDAHLKSAGQLIDLSSPLIRLSPEDKENVVDSPLLLL